MIRWLVVVILLNGMEGAIPTLTQHSIVDDQLRFCQVVFYREPNDDFILKLIDVFEKEHHVKIGHFNAEFALQNSPLFKQKTEADIFGPGMPAIVIFKRSKINRKCLSRLPLPPPKWSRFSSSSLDTVIAQVNDQCQTFRDNRGKLNTAGLHRKTIESNLFEFTGPKMGDLKFKRKSWEWEVTDNERLNKVEIAQCEYRSAESLGYDEFRHEYLERNRPVIVTGVVDHWPALKTWNREFFRDHYQIENEIHVKLGVNGVFEGPELRNLWSSEPVPEFVKDQLEFPELVMARPGQVDLHMSDILALFQNETRDPELDEWISAYIEYTPMTSHFEKLKKDVPEIDYFSDLTLKHQNIWIGDGQTLGKMHFDEFENAMVMIKGAKQFMIYDPRRNHEIYEGHIPEARFGVNKGNSQNKPYYLTRSELMESTSLVMSPVDILAPNYEMFPNFRNARPMNCTVGPGEMLFLPSFWWHEVQSYPDRNEPANIAVNFWYDPFFEKEFPCQSCPLTVNPNYFHIL